LRKKSFISRYPPFKHRVIWSFPLFILPASTLLISVATRSESWLYGGMILAGVSVVARAMGIAFHEKK